MKIFKKIKDIFLNSLYPNNIKCIFCDNDLGDEGLICDECLKNGYLNKGTRCVICDVEIKEGNKICDNCKREKPKFVKAVCPFVYKDNVRSSILKFKSDGAKYLAKPFAKFIFNRLNEENIHFDMIIPVPSHKDTIKKRGYNQAKILADEIALLSGKPVEEVIIKNVKTKTQKSLSFKDRHKNLENSMTLTDKKIIKGKNILLVDDILTTGATVNYCSQLLMGCNGVYVGAIARNEIKNK